MRTTLTLDDDVVARLEKLRRTRQETFKVLVNEALRRGIQDMNAPAAPRRKFRTRTWSGGRPLIDVSNVAEALAIAEGEDYK